MIKTQIEEFDKIFIEIKNKGWIKSKRKGSTGIGYTFESEINKEEDSLPIPDYKDIEIKTMRFYSKRKIHLFCSVPDGDYLFPLKRVIKTLGYPDKDNTELKFNQALNAKDYTEIGHYKRAKLVINDKEQKIDIVGFKGNYWLPLKIDVSWSYKSIREKVEQKIRYLAIIKALSKIENENEYFKYYKVNYYELKSIDHFFKALEDGIISISFTLKCNKNFDDENRIYSHGVSFTINEKDIETIYKKIK